MGGNFELGYDLEAATSEELTEALVRVQALGQVSMAFDHLQLSKVDMQSPRREKLQDHL